MNQVVLTVVVVVACAVASTLGEPIRMKTGMEIVPGDGKSTIPVVQGTKSCGGHGQALQWRYGSCGPDAPCKVIADGKNRAAEVDFIPSSDISSLGLRMMVYRDGSWENVYEKALTDSSVQSGQLYTWKGMGGANKEMIGKNFQLQFLLYRLDDGDTEICIEGEFTVTAE